MLLSEVKFLMIPDREFNFINRIRFWNNQLKFYIIFSFMVRENLMYYKIVHVKIA